MRTIVYLSCVTNTISHAYSYVYIGQRTTELTLVSQKGAKLLLNSLPIIAPIDFQIVFPKWGRVPYYMRGMGLKIYHAHPPLSGVCIYIYYV